MPIEQYLDPARIQSFLGDFDGQGAAMIENDDTLEPALVLFSQMGIQPELLSAVFNEQGNLLSFSKDDETKVEVTARAHELHAIDTIPHSLYYWSRFMNLYLEKILMNAKCIFALYPEVQTFKINFIDIPKGKGISSGMILSETIHRNELDFVEEELRKKYKS